MIETSREPGGGLEFKQRRSELIVPLEYNSKMTRESADLLKKALALPEEERAALAGSLMDSLDAVVDESAEAAWNQEIARRMEDLDSGKAKTIPWDQVRSRICGKLRHGR